LRDSLKQIVTCRSSHPVDGRYPVRAWEAGYLIRDESYLPLPDCLPSGKYELTLSVLPLRRDRAVTTVDDTLGAIPPLSLSDINLSRRPPASAGNIEIWTGGTAYTRGEVELAQIRRALTIITFTPARTAESALVRFAATVETDPALKAAWAPVVPPIAYACDNGSIATTYNFIVDPAVAPDRYRLSVGDQAQSEPVISVLTRRRDFTRPDNIPVPAGANFSGEVELLGYEADLSARWPGETIELTAYWRAQRLMGRTYVSILKLLDHNFDVWGQAEPMMGGRYPTVLWAPGETMVETYTLPIDPQTPAGLYNIEFSVLYGYVAGEFYFIPVSTPTNGSPVEHLYLGPIRVMDPAGLEGPTQPLEVAMDNQIELLGYDLAIEDSAVEQQLQLTLHWQAINPPEADYTVFVQLIGPDGQVKTQQDNQPQAGRYPTTAWTLQDRVVDRYNLIIPDETPTGQYRLLAGMYDLKSGRRLPAFTDGQRWPGDAILITTVELDEDRR
jgi:hypothetical protein